MKKHYVFLLLATFIFLGPVAEAQNLEFQWAKAITGDDETKASKIVTDNQSSSYVIGTFKGTADFDPGPGTANLTVGTNNNFFAKYDSMGNYVFATQLGDGGGATSFSKIMVDNNQDVYIVGGFYDTVDIDPGSGINNIISNGTRDIFIAKFDKDGNLLHAFTFGSVGNEVIADIVCDKDNNIYITGTFRDTVDFDPGPGTHYLYNPSGNVYAYTAKYTVNGDLVFAFNFDSYSSPVSLAIDTAGNLFVSGDASTTIDLNPTAGIDTVSLTGQGNYVAKYDADGNYQSGIGFTSSDINEIRFDSENNLYTLGRLVDSLDADPGPGVSMLYSLNPDLYDLYFVKYDADFNLINTYVTSGQGHYYEAGFVINQSDDIYFCGRINDTIDFDPDNSGGEVNFSGYIDGWITKLDNNFDFLHVGTFGTPNGIDEPQGMAVYEGSVWATGNFRDTVDFDLESGTANLISTPNQYTAFIVKYKDIQASSVTPIAIKTPEIKAYGGDDRVIIDFTSLEKMNGRVKVLNMMGQTIADVKHNRNDMLKIDLPGTTEQIYVVVIENDRKVTAKKVWVR